MRRHLLRTLHSYQAQELVASLEWLNTPIPHRLRKIIFTPDAPVSGQWKALIVSLPPLTSARRYTSMCAVV